MKGELLLQKAEDLLQPDLVISLADSCFQDARRVACQQDAKMLELRAVASLCRLWKRQGKGKQGVQLLSEIANWFTEGTDGPELIEANNLLAELQK